MTEAIEKKERIKWVDCLRGWAIILVVIGHFPIDETLKLYIYSFHIPLFFILSGLTFNALKYSGIKEFIKHKAKMILLPYLCLNISYFAIWVVIMKIVNNSAITLFELFKGLIFANNDKVYLLNGPTWFLPTLFLIEVVAYLLIKYFNDDPKHLAIISSVLLLLGYAESIVSPKVFMIWHMNSVPIGVFMFMMGYLFYKYYTNDKNTKEVVDKIKPYIGIILILIGLYFALKNGRVSFGGNIYNYIIYTLIAVFSSSFGYLIIFKRLSEVKSFNTIMSYIGKNTLFILGFHKVLLHFLKGFDVSVVYTMWGSIALAILSILLTTLFSMFVNKVCPFVIGKLEKTKSNIISFVIYTIISLILLVMYCI